jgi:hypothetical protein
MIIKISWREKSLFSTNTPNDGIKMNNHFNNNKQTECIDKISNFHGFKRYRDNHTLTEYFDHFRIVNMQFEFDDTIDFDYTSSQIEFWLNVKVI